jgi:nitrogen fixation/metabolism regulation signal transduction histidine kinase
MPDRRLRRIVVAAGGAALAAALLGGVLERVRFGASDAATAARVQADVRARFNRIVAALRMTGQSIAGQPALIQAASGAAPDPGKLMDLTDSTLVARPREIVALSVYGPDNAPLAWSGRPSELPAERIGGPEAYFVAPGPLGPRLIHTLPVTNPSDARRLGTVASEWALPGASAELSGGLIGSTDSILFDALVPVVLRPRYEGGGATPRPDTFVISAPNGELLLEASVSATDLINVRRGWRRGVVNVVLTIFALTLILIAGPFLQRRRDARTTVRYLSLTGTILGLFVLARAALWFALAGPWAQPALLDTPPTQGVAPLLLRSAPDLLFSSVFCLSIVGLTVDGLERWRVAYGRRRSRWNERVGTLVPFVVTQGVAGALMAAVVHGYQRFLADALTGTSIDLLHFSLHPWNFRRLAFAAGLIALHATVLWAVVLMLCAAALVWRFSWRDKVATVLLVASWVAGLLLIFSFNSSAAVPAAPFVWACGVAMLLTLTIGRGRAPYRHASQGFRLVVSVLAVIVPALVLYPAVLNVANRATRQLIETQFGPEALMQREQVQERVERSRMQIDRIQGLEDLAGTSGPPSSGAAYSVWASTDLARYLLTSSVELYGPSGSLVSRFAFNLPEENAGVVEDWQQQGCGWETYEEVSPYASEERRLLFAGLGLCRPDGRMSGAIVIRAMLDYDALSFISARSLPYELLRPHQVQQEGSSGRDVEFVVYGWSRRPIYTSTGSAWMLDDSVFRQMTASRMPRWITRSSGGRTYDVYLLNDRAGIYAVGSPQVSVLGHVINLAEAATLAAVLYVVMLAGATLFSLATGFGPASGRALLREIRASFYRKLFLAFVLVSVFPVIILALVTRAFFTTQANATLEAAAIRTAATAQRVIEDYSTLIQRDATGLPNLDDLMVGISRTIDQHVNIFEGQSLRATSERFLFESRLLSERTPNRVYRAIALERRSSFVDEETIGGSSYLVAATPVRVQWMRDAILTVPLTLRQQEVERQVDELNRRVLLAAVVFILLGAAAGYSMAERIADPVNRLTRATRRITRGDLDARILETASDELRTLITAFNRMATELRHQRAELERTYRIAAWAEMARQVAHEIKNPLTPIQLSAEHLQRLHLDRGKPLTPVLEDCLAVILSQVRLLRQIASEFSAFAASPTAHLAPTPLADLVHEVVAPYRTGLPDHVHISEDVPGDLPRVNVDRTLFARALTNVIENALHAMPSGGSIAITATCADSRVRLSIADTGAGMEPEALQRVFEPYFSTKTGGTGLGLPIAKRNIELSGGTITVESQKGVGTTVIIDVPVAPEARP